MKIPTAKEFNHGVNYYASLESDHLFSKRLQIYKEHNVYHVRVFHCVNNSPSSTRLIWQVFETLKDVKQFIKGLKQ